MQYRKLNNGIKMPEIVMGTSLWDRKGSKSELYKLLENSVRKAIVNQIWAFDTAPDYYNEELLGKIFKDAERAGEVQREDLFITTKVGNNQQISGDMRRTLEMSLKALQMDYVDLWLLHWPYPDYYIKNWKQLEEIYHSGKVKAIGLCNCRERHLERLFEQDIEIKPQVIQIEYHPFRTVPEFVEKCKREKIQMEAYSALCNMLPMVKENKVLKCLALKYNKTIPQIIMKWHIQQGVIPIFSSLNPIRIKANIDIDDFELTALDLAEIFALNIDYKFHPESMNCPGY
ncbi:MAG: aldo/keto reductase [Odoribacter sp.]